MKSTDRAVIRIQDWRVDPWLDEISRDGRVINLEPRAMRALMYLAEHAGEVVSIDTLLAEAWSGVVVTSDSVYQTIATLRRTLGEGGKGSEFIVNVPRRGYRLVAPVSPWVEPTEPQAVAPSVPAPQGMPAPQDVPAPQNVRRRRLPWLIAAGAAVAIMGAIGLQWSRHVPASPSPGKITFPISLAVLPFEDLSEKSDRRYLAEGMTQELIDTLSHSPDFRIIGRASSFRFSNHSDDFVTIGRQLGAAYLLTGNIRTEGARLRVAVKINAASDGTQLWSQSLNGPLDEALRIEDDIAKNVSRTLAGSLGVAPSPNAQRAVDPAAFAALLRGIHEFFLFDRQSLEQAAHDFQTALDLDPHYDRAATFLAGVRIAQASFEFVPVREGFEKARTAAAAAIASNPALADGHSAMAKIHLWYDWDWDAAEAEIKRSFQLQPNSSLSNWDAAELALALGRWDESIHRMEVSVGDDPMDGDLQITLGAMLYAAGRLREAEAATRKGLELLPGYVSGYYYLGKILISEGRIKEAHAEMLKDTPDGGQLQGLTMTYYLLGQHAESDSALQRAIKESGQTMTCETAMAYSVRGERDQAFQWLDRAYEEKSPALYKIKAEPLFDNLKSDPRYAAFLKKMKLPL